MPTWRAWEQLLEVGGAVRRWEAGGSVEVLEASSSADVESTRVEGVLALTHVRCALQ